MTTTSKSGGARELIGAVASREVVMALGLVGTLGLLIVPLPPPVLDFLLACSIALAIVVFLVSFYVKNSMDFSVFPVLLLISTVFRLSLNISSTRLILSNGEDGTVAAGKIIETFGNFVTGGNFAVGLVIFIILIIINFMVVTKGAGRIAEVAARFTLDAMPGKQMAIDADLNAGLIDDDEARKRRKAVALEADFHGAMDGASKFIRGDAIAGIMVTAINLVGGLFIGVVQVGMSASQAAETYSVLTIGDGLVSQIPALVISMAAGMLVTRVAGTGDSLHDELTGQLFGSSRVLGVTSGILLAFTLIRGLTVPFLILSIGMGVLAWYARKKEREGTTPEGGGATSTGGAAKAKTAAPQEEEEVHQVETLELEVGFDIIPLVDERRGGELMARIVRLRKQFARALGIVVPPIQVRDNLRLQSTQYSILLRGTEVAKGELRPGYWLAIDPGGRAGGAPVPGIPGKEPAFGLPALWVKDSDKGQAEVAGYTVVDPVTVLATHLSEIIKKYAPEFIGRQEVQQMMDRTAKTHPRVVDDLVPNLLPLGTVLTVLRGLLREGVSVRDLLTILETLADQAPRSKDADFLTERVRQALGRQISAQHSDENGSIHYIALARPTEEMIRAGIQRGPEGTPSQLVLDPAKAQSLLARLNEEIERHAAGQVMPVILAAPTIRGALRRLTERTLPQISVLSPNELNERTRLKRLGTVAV
jgi:flagellar biosynthesis protein FlhA